MPKVLFNVDLTKPMDKQELVGHNRWHPDIPAVVSVNPGEVFRIECKDWTDGQIQNDDSPNDVRDVDLSVVHVLSGPIWVNGAKPGISWLLTSWTSGLSQLLSGVSLVSLPRKMVVAFLLTTIPMQLR